MKEIKIEQDFIDSIISSLSFEIRSPKIIQVLKSIRTLCNILIIWLAILLIIGENNLPKIIFCVFIFLVILCVNLYVINEENQYRNESLQFIKRLKEEKEYVLLNLSRFRLYRKLSEEKQSEVKKQVDSLLGYEYTKKNYKDLLDSRFDNFNDFEFTNDVDLLARLFINQTDLDIETDN